jgi:hypothetical protein
LNVKRRLPNNLAAVAIEAFMPSRVVLEEAGNISAEMRRFPKAGEAVVA